MKNKFIGFRFAAVGATDFFLSQVYYHSDVFTVSRDAFFHRSYAMQAGGKGVTNFQTDCFELYPLLLRRRCHRHGLPNTDPIFRATQLYRGSGVDSIHKSVLIKRTCLEVASCKLTAYKAHRIIHPSHTHLHAYAYIHTYTRAQLRTHRDVTECTLYMYTCIQSTDIHIHAQTYTNTLTKTNIHTYIYTRTYAVMQAQRRSFMYAYI